MAEIDSLTLRITSDSDEAADGLKKLTSTLEAIKTATSSGLGLGAIASQITEFADATARLNWGTFDNLKRLTTALSSLSALKDVKIPANMVKQLTTLTTTLASMNLGEVEFKIKALVEAFKPLETLGKSGLSSMVKHLRQIPEIFYLLRQIDMGEFEQTILRLAQALKPLADELQKVANGVSALPSKLLSLINKADRTAKSNKALSFTFTELYHKVRMSVTAIKTIYSTISKFVKLSNDYVEDQNLFNVAMGSYATSASEYAQNVADVMGIDPGEWMRNQGTFMTLATGFGVAAERANVMSESLTGLGHDLASLFNIDTQDAMLKLQSGLAGELEPLRRIGFDLSQARLQIEATNLGIKKKVSQMTQAEKAEIRYHAILTQVTQAHGDMARTLDQPANQLRVLKSQIVQAGRAIGNIFIPGLKAILPYAIAVMKVVKILADIVAQLAGYEPYEPPAFSASGITSATDEIADGFDNATESAKKLQKYTMGFDELNIIDPNQGSGANDALSGAGFNFDLETYDFLGEANQSKVNELVDKFKEWLGITDEIETWSDLFDTKLGSILKTVGLVGIGLLGWKLSTSLVKQIDNLLIGVGAGLVIKGVFATLDEGITWGSVITTALGGAFIGAGIGHKIAGIPGAIVGFGIGVGVSLIITGITDCIADGEISTEGVVSIITGALTTIGFIIGAVKLFNKTHKSPVGDFDTAGKTIGDTGAGMSKLTRKLKDLVINIGLATAVIAEVAIASMIIVGSIWVLTKIMGEIGEAWEGVKANGDNVLIAMTVGTGILTAVGALCAVLGKSAKSGGGAKLVVEVALGAAVLAEISLATDLFLAEIWVIGKLLDEVGKAWQPVIDEGETIITAIEVGTGLLIGVAAITAVLGLATTATGGALPLAIGLGTAILVEMALATALFIDSLTDIATKFSDELHPALKGLNKILPDLNEELADYKDFLIKFAGITVDITKSNAVSGFSATVSKIIGFFTADPIKALSEDVEKQYGQLTTLNKHLGNCNPAMLTAIDGVTIYKNRIERLKDAADGIDTSEMNTKAFSTMESVSGKLEAFGKKFKDYYDYIKDIKVATMDNIVSCINDVIDFAIRIKNNVDTKKINDFADALKDLTKAIKDLPTSKTVTIKAIYQTSGTAPQGYATGGYPETGQMFVAREAGAELVGTIGRKTAVVNNEQIVASVSRGVAEANDEQNGLLREQNELLRALLGKDSGVYLDGKQLTNSVEKYQRQRGRQIVVGGGI